MLTTSGGGLTRDCLHQLVGDFHDVYGRQRGQAAISIHHVVQSAVAQVEDNAMKTAMHPTLDDTRK